MVGARAVSTYLAASMELSCSNCGATLRVDDSLRTSKCPYCANPQIVQRPPSPGRVEPTFVLGFAQTEQTARELVAHWLKSRGFFRDPALKKAEIVDLRGVYVPAYLYTVTAHAEYQAQIGEHYTETETYTTTENGKTVTRTRQVTKTEWRDLAGTLSRYVSDVVVTASRGVQNDELEAVEPFDLRAMGRYTPAVLSGWIAEEPTLPQEECARLAREEAHRDVTRFLDQFMPGDSHQLTHTSLRFENEAADLIYVPLWILAARHDPNKPPVRILVNGQTGKLLGKAPLSWLRIVVVVVLVLIAIGVAVFVGSQQ